MRVETALGRVFLYLAAGVAGRLFILFYACVIITQPKERFLIFLFIYIYIFFPFFYCFFAFFSPRHSCEMCFCSVCYYSDTWLAPNFISSLLEKIRRALPAFILCQCNRTAVTIVMCLCLEAAMPTSRDATLKKERRGGYIFTAFMGLAGLPVHHSRCHLTRRVYSFGIGTYSLNRIPWKKMHLILKPNEKRCLEFQPNREQSNS